MPLIGIVVSALKIAFGFLIRSAIPWLWRTVIGRLIPFVWRNLILKPWKWLFGIISFVWSWGLGFFRIFFTKLLGFVLLFRLAIMFLASLTFFKWAFLALFAVVLYNILSTFFGINLVVGILLFLLPILSWVMDFVLDLIFSLVSVEAFVTAVNEYFGLLPPCMVTIMFACGLNEALNMMVSTSSILIVVRVVMWIVRR